MEPELLWGGILPSVMMDASNLASRTVCQSTPKCNYHTLSLIYINNHPNPIKINNPPTKADGTGTVFILVVVVVTIRYDIHIGDALHIPATDVTVEGGGK